MSRPLLAVAVVVALHAAGAAALWHRAEYKSWPWAGPPLWLDHCGRTYERAADSTPDPVDEWTDEPLHVAFRAPPVVGRRVLVPRATCDGPVPTVVFRDAGDERVIPYGLLGGP